MRPLNQVGTSMIKKFASLKKTAASYGMTWLIQRLLYEFQVRSGLQARRFRQRPWDANELARWLRPEVPADPAAFAASWHANRRPVN